MDEEIPLTDEDRAILDLEDSTVAGHMIKVIRLGSPGVEVEALRSSVGRRIASAPELTRRLAGRPGAPCWQSDPNFSIDRHIAVHAGGEELTRDEIRRATAELLAERLDRSLPLWRVDVAPTTGGGSTLIWQIHHVMADGSTAMRLARQILWDHSETAGQPQPKSAESGHNPAESRPDENRRRLHILGLFERELERSPSPSPFDGEIGSRRAVSFATVSMTDLHDSAKSLAGATLNDAVLAVVAGALRHWMDVHDGLEADSIRVKVPVSLHHGGDDAGNRDSYFALPLPLGDPDPLSRLAGITAATGERKADQDAEELDALLHRVSQGSKRLGHLLAKLESSPRRFALNVSNVKGPRGKVSVLGAPVETVHSVVEIGRHHALRIAVLSVGDRLCFGFCADPDLVVDLDEMAAGAEIEAALLAALAAGRS